MDWRIPASATIQMVVRHARAEAALRPSIATGVKVPAIIKYIPAWSSRRQIARVPVDQVMRW